MSFIFHETLAQGSVLPDEYYQYYHSLERHGRDAQPHHLTGNTYTASVLAGGKMQMTELTLDTANQIVSGAIKHAREINAAPICVAVLDNRGIVRALQTEDGCALLRPDIAQGKAWG